MKINYEIVGLYPLYGYPEQHLTFSAHVYIIEPLPMDIRGWMINYKVEGDSYVYVPMGKNYDYEEKKVIGYPIIESDQKDWLFLIKQDLIKEAKKEFETFKFPPRFPKGFAEYQKKYLKLAPVNSFTPGKKGKTFKKSFSDKRPRKI